VVVVAAAAEVGCSCMDWNTQVRRRKASMQGDVYSWMAGSSNA